MACFWNGLIKMLLKEELISRKIDAEHLLSIVKYFNDQNMQRRRHTVEINGKCPTKKQMMENYHRIMYINSVNDGYDCSSFDPVLIIICEIYRVNIEHDFVGNVVTYFRKKNKKTIKVFSNKEHFYV